jgi:sulfane dehydrogenase subunit SoxC
MSRRKSKEGNEITRRTLLATAAAGVGAAMTKATGAPAQEPSAAEATDHERRLVSELGERSPFVDSKRMVRRVAPSANSLTPLQDLQGVITPSDLHYERHHTGVPIIDPDKYTLRIEGMVERPTTFTLMDLKSFPEHSELRYMECGSNGGRAFAGIRPDQTPQQIDGRISTSEWVGIYLSSLWDAVGVKDGATWFRIEGHDGGWEYAIPLVDRFDKSMVAYGQNGEALRPEQGYPVRLILAGHPGGPNIKWLSRLELNGDPMPEQAKTAFSSVMGAKSLITYPAYPNVLPEPGPITISGLAWTGKGKITRVDVSTDGGSTWSEAELQAPVLSLCQTRFRYRWNWDGREALLMSRAVDETGDVQLTLEAARAAREANENIRHWNTNIRAWAIKADGSVVFGLS